MSLSPPIRVVLLQLPAALPQLPAALLQLPAALLQLVLQPPRQHRMLPLQLLAIIVSTPFVSVTSLNIPTQKRILRKGDRIIPSIGARNITPWLKWRRRCGIFFVDIA